MYMKMIIVFTFLESSDVVAGWNGWIMISMVWMIALISISD